MQIRLLAVQIADDLFQRSSVFRRHLVGFFRQFVEVCQSNKQRAEARRGALIAVVTAAAAGVWAVHMILSMEPGTQSMFVFRNLCMPRSHHVQLRSATIKLSSCIPAHGFHNLLLAGVDCGKHLLGAALTVTLVPYTHLRQSLASVPTVRCRARHHQQRLCVRVVWP